MTDVDKSIKRRINVLLEGILSDAKDSFPIIDNYLRFVSFLRSWKDSSKLFSSVTFSSGKRSSIFSVSMMIPRYVIILLGFTIFSGTNGIPRFEKTVIAGSRFIWQMFNAAGPAIK